MKKDIDPRVRRWLERFDAVQGVFDTVEMSAGKTLAEKGAILDMLCRDATAFLEGRPDGREVLARKHPRSPESVDLWRRLVARHRADRARGPG